jgi:L-threonylcarbamoyladenylate synthase
VTLFRARRAAQMLQRGAVIAYPTEAVFGLGCDPNDEDAVLRLLAIKGRSWEQGLILVAANFAQLRPYVLPLDPRRMARLRKSWPGPETWVLPAAPETPPWLTGLHPGLAVRVSAHPAVQRLCRAFGGPLVSTSANRSGRAPARSSLAVRRRLGDKLDLIMGGATSGLARPTPIRDAATGAVLRR